MAKRAEARDSTRQSLLAAATQLMMDKGTANITMLAVAELANVAPRTAYNHFASVDALLAAVMATINEEFSALAPAPVDTVEVSPERVLRELVAQWFDELTKQDSRLSALITIRDSAELDEALATARELRIQRVRPVLALAEERGQLRVPLDDAVAMAYVQTSYQCWVALVRQLGMSSPDAAELVTSSIAAFAFKRRPRRAGVGAG